MQKFIKQFFLIFGCTIFLLACSNQKPLLKEVPSSGTILAFGDSLTYGTGASPETSYPAYLEQLTNIKVINDGIPGEETSEGAARIAEELTKYNPDLVIVCLGGNDLIRKRPYPDIKNNLKTIIERIQDHGVQVVLVGVPALGVYLETPDFYQQLGKELNIPVETEAFQTLLQHPKYKADYIHLNSDGYKAFAEKLATFLKNEGAITNISKVD